MIFVNIHSGHKHCLLISSDAHLNPEYDEQLTKENNKLKCLNEENYDEIGIKFETLLIP